MFNFEVLVDGRPVKRYYDRSGQIWIEGRKGTQFTLRVKNNSHGRILGIVSVDGLNVVDGKHVPIEDSRGYVLNSYSSINIPGWKINQDEVREFYFTVNGRDSYVRKIGADERNIGVIAAAVYKEKQYPITYTYNLSGTSIDYSTNVGNWNVYDDGHVNELFTASDIPEPDMQVFNMSADVSPRSGYIKSSSSRSPKMDIRERDQSVSVGSGERAEFRTRKVDFDRGDFEGEVIIRYDTWEGLKRRGVLREDREYHDRPRPFPNGQYCPDV
jgi:hypothetical protein